MPYARGSEGYPLQLAEAIRAVLETNTTHRVRCESQRRAASLKTRFCQYRVACRRDAAHPPSHWSPAKVEEHRQWTQLLESLEFISRGEEFMIRPLDKSPVMQELARLAPVDEAGEPNVATPNEKEAEESLDRLLTKVGLK